MVPVRWSVGGERVLQLRGLERPFGWSTGCEGSMQVRCAGLWWWMSSSPTKPGCGPEGTEGPAVDNYPESEIEAG